MSKEIEFLAELETELRIAFEKARAEKDGVAVSDGYLDTFGLALSGKYVHMKGIAIADTFYEVVIIEDDEDVECDCPECQGECADFE